MNVNANVYHESGDKNDYTNDNEISDEDKNEIIIQEAKKMMIKIMKMIVKISLRVIITTRDQFKNVNI